MKKLIFFIIIACFQLVQSQNVTLYGLARIIPTTPASTTDENYHFSFFPGGSQSIYVPNNNINSVIWFDNIQVYSMEDPNPQFSVFGYTRLVGTLYNCGPLANHYTFDLNQYYLEMNACNAYAIIYKLKIIGNENHVVTPNQNVNLIHPINNYSQVLNYRKVVWYYQKVGEPFEEFPANYQNQVLNFTPNDIPDLQNYYGDLKIKFAITDFNDNILSNAANNFESDLVNVNIIKSPPQIVGNPIVIDPVCHGATGSITLNFDRDLDASNNEYFNFNLYEYQTATGEWVDTGFTVEAEDYNNNQYTFHTDAGSYFLTYQTTYTDSNGTPIPTQLSDSLYININNPPPVQFTVTKNDVSCYGDNNGSITFIPDGYPQYHLFSIDGGQSWVSGNPQFNNLAPGTYPTLVKNIYQCIAPNGIQNVTISEPDELEVNVIAEENPTEFGASDGYITLSTSGGTPFADPNSPYTYQWYLNVNQNSQIIGTTNALQNLSEGTYHVVVTDARGCVKQRSFDLVAPAPIEITFTQEGQLLCYGDETMNLNASVTGGVTPYQSLSWSNGVSGNFNENVGAGNYTFAVTDYNGVQASADITLVAPPELNGFYDIQNVSCHGGNDGNIVLQMDGGVQPYQYEWTHNGNIISTDEFITNASSGLYNCEVTDAHACSIIFENISVTQPTAPISITPTVFNTTISGGSDGSIVVVVNGGTPFTNGEPYQYQWDNGQTVANLDNLSAGDYTLTVTDSKGCQAQITITIEDPSPLSVQLVQVDSIYCHGASTASIQAQVQGGLGGYTYNWYLDGSLLSQTSQQISGLGVGNYSVSVHEDGGQMASDSIVISQPAEISSIYTIQNPSCNDGSDGSIQIMPVGGSGSYNFQWFKDGFIGATQNLENITAGIYTVYISDANYLNCPSTSLIIEVTEPSALTLDSYQITHPSGYGVANGMITIDIQGGTPPYTYNWSNGESTQNVESLNAGTYEVTVTDSLGCMITQNFTLIEPDQLIATIQQTSDVLCFGSNEGALGASAQGGIPPYSYSWDNGELGQVISDLEAGNYIVTVTDQFGNTANASFEIEEPTELSVTFSATDIPCSGDEVGSLTTNVSGGTPPYSYHWSNNETTPTINNLAVGNYPIIISDANGCILQSFGSVASESGIEVVANIVHPSCVNESDGSISLSITGGSGNYSLSWAANVGSGNEASNLPAGIYEVLITDIDNNCIIPWQGQLIDPEPLSLDLGADQILCMDQSTTLDATIPGEEDATYLWVSDNGFTSTSAAVELETAGIYTVTVTTQEGCVISDDVEIIEVNEVISSNFAVATHAYVNEEIILINTNPDTINTITWLLPPEAIVLSSSRWNTEIKFPAIGTYQVGMQVQSPSGCESTTYYDVIVEEEPLIPGPNEVDEPFVQEFIIYPNPTQQGGTFTIKVVLSEEAAISTTIYQVGSGTFINQSDFGAQEIHQHEYNLNITTGAYWVILRTPRMVLSKKLIVQ